MRMTKIHFTVSGGRLVCVLIHLAQLIVFTRADAETGYTVEIVYGGSEDNEEGGDEGTRRERLPVTLAIGNLLGGYY